MRQPVVCNLGTPERQKSAAKKKPKDWSKNNAKTID